MHLGQIGFEHTRQCSVAGSECLAHRSRTAVPAGVSSGRAISGVWIRIRGDGGAITAAGAPCPTGRETGGAGVGETGTDLDNSWRIRLLTASEASSPQVWHTNLIGRSAISGVTSKAYLAPQEHWIFIGLMSRVKQDDALGQYQGKWSAGRAAFCMAIAKE